MAIQGERPESYILFRKVTQALHNTLDSVSISLMIIPQKISTFRQSSWVLLALLNILTTWRLSLDSEQSLQTGFLAKILVGVACLLSAILITECDLQEICINDKITTSQSKRRIDRPMPGPFPAPPPKRKERSWERGWQEQFESGFEIIPVQFNSMFISPRLYNNCIKKKKEKIRINWRGDLKKP